MEAIRDAGDIEKVLKGGTMRPLVAALICLFFMVAVTLASPAPELVDFFSFEQDFEGWAPMGVDLEIGSTTEDWSITRSQNMARDGVTSLHLFLDNRNDAGKIWIQRAFALQPSQTYQVQVNYALAGPFGPAFIIAGALTSPPVTSDDLASSFQDATTRGTNKWIVKRFEFTGHTDDTGTLFVIVGIWGTFEGPLTYFVDAVRTTFTRRQAGAAEPLISSVAFNGLKKLRISGSAFGPSPRVIINNVDRSDFIRLSSDSFVGLKGTESDIFGSSRRGTDNTVIVVDDTTAAASQPFHLTLPD